jgi:hypothetical protein
MGRMIPIPWNSLSLVRWTVAGHDQIGFAGHCALENPVVVRIGNYDTQGGCGNHDIGHNGDNLEPANDEGLFPTTN